jgi:hypothetical protein
MHRTMPDILEWVHSSRSQLSTILPPVAGPNARLRLMSNELAMRQIEYYSLLFLAD